MPCLGEEAAHTGGDGAGVEERPAPAGTPAKEAAGPDPEARAVSEGADETAGAACTAVAQPGRPADGGHVRRENGRARQRRQREAEEQDTPLYRLKVEGAHALGLWDKVQTVGWGGLSAAESGRVGGYITRILRAQRQEGVQDAAPPAGGR